jgi:putative intracellular protease/amidase
VKTARLRVALYVNNPQATILRFVRCLRSWNMDFITVWRDELKNLKPGAADVLLLHGGWYGIDRTPGQEQYGPLRKTRENEAMAAAVRKFVAAGGGIVGVCAGAFNVVWLGLIEADISRTAGTGPHALEVVEEKHPIWNGVLERATGRTDRRWLPVPVARVNGPIFFAKHPHQTIASYDWERRLGAILAAPYGQGRAVAISPHPEFIEGESPSEGSILDGEPARAALLLRNALYWSTGGLVLDEHA